MRRVSPAATLTTLTATCALLLAGCGGGGGGGNSGAADKGGSGGDRARADFRTTKIKLPDDLKLDFDWKRPEDPQQAAALAGAADFQRALRHGTVEQDPKDPQLLRHTVPGQTAREFAATLIDEDVQDKHTLTGTERYYKERVGRPIGGKLVKVSFCIDQSKLFDKRRKSGKVLRTSPSAASYLRYHLVMRAPTAPGKPWTARNLDGEADAKKKCRA